MPNSPNPLSFYVFQKFKLLILNKNFFSFPFFLKHTHYPHAPSMVVSEWFYRTTSLLLPVPSSSVMKLSSICFHMRELILHNSLTFILYSNKIFIFLNILLSGRHLSKLQYIFSNTPLFLWSGYRKDIAWTIFPTIFSDGIYEFQLRSGISLSLIKHSRQGAVLKGQPFMMTGENSSQLSHIYIFTHPSA